MVIPGLAETIISSGTTVSSSAVTFPVTVESGGTLSVDQSNVGTTSDRLTISGTGNGQTTSGVPLGAIYSTSYPNMNLGIFAATHIDGSASVLGTQRLRFQGEVTGGILYTYASAGENPEVHAGYASAFAIDQLVVELGNFTFHGSNGTNNNTSQDHIFYDGILVKNGGNLRLWHQNQLNLYADDAKTTLATITFENGARFLSQGDIPNSFAGNLVVAANATGYINFIRQLTMTAGTISGAFQKEGTAELTLGKDVSWVGSLTITNGTVRFQSGSTFSGTIQTRTTETTAGILALEQGSSVTLTENSTIYRMGAFSGEMIVSAGKTLTLSNVTTTNADNPGTLTLQNNSRLSLPANSTTALNADIVLAGNATLLPGKASQLTTDDVTGNYTLTVTNDGNPAKSWSVGDVNLEKLQMVNSIAVTADSVAASVVFYNSHWLTIRENGSLLLGSDGIQKVGTNVAGICNVVLSNGTMVGLKSGVTTATVQNMDNKGTTDAIFTQLRGATTFDLNDGETLFWKSQISGSGSLTKTGAGTLSLSGRQNSLSQMTLSEGRTVLAGDYTLTNGLTLAESAILEADGVVDVTGNFAVNGRLEMTLNVDGGDLWNVDGDVSFGENSSLFVDLAGEVSNGGFYPFLETDGAITDWENLSVVFSQQAAYYLLPEIYALNGSLGFRVDSAAVPEPSTGVLFLLFVAAGGWYFRSRRG